MPSVTLVDHPLIQQKLTEIRRKDTDVPAFRSRVNEIGMLLAYEATRFLPLTTVQIETPLTTMDAPTAAVDDVVIVPILRAGLGLLEGFLRILPEARVGHVGLKRNEVTFEPEQYYLNLPDNLSTKDVILVDPMLATGGSSAAAATLILEAKPRSLRLVVMVAAPEGIAHFHALHPDVPIVTGAIDDRLNDQAYIVPGLGDAGDRIFGTV